MRRVAIRVALLVAAGLVSFAVHLAVLNAVAHATGRRVLSEGQALRAATRRVRQLERAIVAGQPYRLRSPRSVACSVDGRVGACEFTTRLSARASSSTVITCTGAVRVSAHGRARLGEWVCIA